MCAVGTSLEGGTQTLEDLIKWSMRPSWLLRVPSFTIRCSSSHWLVSMVGVDCTESFSDKAGTQASHMAQSGGTTKWTSEGACLGMVEQDG
jgi:hypothetical protein